MVQRAGVAELVQHLETARQAPTASAPRRSRSRTGIRAKRSQRPRIASSPPSASTRPSAQARVHTQASHGCIARSKGIGPQQRHAQEQVVMQQPARPAALQPCAPLGVQAAGVGMADGEQLLIGGKRTNASRISGGGVSVVSARTAASTASGEPSAQRRRELDLQPAEARSGWWPGRAVSSPARRRAPVAPIQLQLLAQRRQARAARRGRAHKAPGFSQRASTASGAQQPGAERGVGTQRRGRCRAGQGRRSAALPVRPASRLAFSR